MDINNGSLGFKLTLDNEDFNKKWKESINNVNNYNKQLQNSFNRSLLTVNDLNRGITAFLSVSAAKGFITEMVKVRGEFEKTELAFNTMLQSHEKSNTLMKDMVELAKNTPMQFSEVTKGAKQLLAYQVEAEKLTETLSMLGDISSGLDVPLSRLILVYGQVRAKGRLMGDDLRQFTEAGVPMIAMIAKNMGVAQSAVSDMVSEGKVGFKEVEKVLKDLTSQGGLFYNMMNEQSKTIPGQIAKLQDEIEVMFNEIGKDSQGFITDIVSGASYAVEHYREIAKVLGILVATYGTYRAAIIATSALQASQTILGNVQAFLQLARTIRTAKDAQLAFNIATSANPYAIAAAAIAGLVAVLYNLNDELTLAEKTQNSISEATENATKSIKSEQDELTRLITIAKDERISKENRLKAIKKINDISPKYLSQINLENINTQLAVKAVDAYTTALIKNAKAKAFQAKYDELVNQRIDASNKTAEDYMSGSTKFGYKMGIESGSYDEVKKLKTYADVLDYVSKIEGKHFKTREELEKRAKAFYKNIGLDKKHIEIAQYDAQLIDTEKELIKSQSEIEKTVTEIDQTIDDAGKKTKSTKKKDDPVEKFKKQVEEIKKEYERYVKYINSDDLSLKATAILNYSSLKKNGANYEEYLRNIQKKLVDNTNKTKDQVKELKFINDELQEVINYNAFDKYKEQINDQITSSNKLLDVIEKVQQEKQKFANSTNPIEQQKFKFLDEKEIELMKRANDEAKNLLDTLSKEANPLEAIKNSFDNQLFLLKKTILDAQNEINKLTDQNNTLDPSDPNTEDTRVKNEQTILKLKKSVLLTQNLIDYNEKKRENAIKKTPTDNADYNQLLEQYQDFETKKKNIASEYEDKLTTVRDERIELQNNKELQANQTLLDQMLAQNTATENELEKQKKDAISKITLEQFKNSDLYMKMILGDLDKMSSQTMQDIINGFDEALRNPEIGGKMNLEEFKVIEDRVKEMKEKLSQNGFNPFQALQNNFAIFKENFEKGFTDIDGKLDFKNIGGMIQGLKGGLNESINLVEGLGINVSDTTKDSIKLGLELFEAGSQIAQGIVSGNPQDILAGLYKGASAIINARKKARESEKKAQEELKKYQDEIFSSQLEYNKLLRERYLTEARINDLYVSRIQNIHEEKDALSKSLKSVVQDQQNIFNRLLNAETITSKSTKKKGGFLGIGRKTVVVEHTSTVAQLLGLQQGAQLTDEIFEKLQRLNAEKPLTGDAKDAYEQLKKIRDEYGSIDDAMKDLEIKLKDALTGTTAQNIADSIIDGLKSGKSSFQDFAEDVEGFLRNAIISGMSAKIIEPEMQKLQDALADMMGDGVLTDEEKKKWQEMYAKVAKDAQNYFDVMDQAGIGLSSLSNPNQKSLSGVIKGMSEQEGNIMSGHLNATRILTKDILETLQGANKQRDLSNKILLQQLDRLANIDYNTKSVLPLLERLINRIENAGRAYGF